MIKQALILSTILATTFALGGCLGAAAAGGAAAGNAAGSNLSIGTQVDDLTIKARAINTLNDFPQLLGKSNIEIVVFDHIVLLLGQVPTEEYRNKVAEKISKISNIRVIYNKLTIGKPVTIRTYAYDAWLTTKVKAAFIGKVNPTAFDVVTEDGVVYILGYTNPADGAVAATAASQVGGVKKVVKAFFYLPKVKPADIKNGIPDADERTAS